MYVSEESLLNKYYLEPFELVGWEGFWGTILYVIAIPILNIIPCPYNPVGYEKDLCAGEYIEDFPLFINEATYKWQLVLAIVIVMFTKALSNSFGVTVTKNVSSVARTILGSTRTLFVWIVELALKWEDFESL
jgi:hypothetical protein